MNDSLRNIHLSGLFLYILPLLWVFTGTSAFQTSMSGSVLDLSRIDSVRVSLFDVHPQTSAELFTEAAEMTIWGESTKTLHKDSLRINIEIRDGRIWAETGDSGFQADSIAVQSSHHTRVITERFGYRYYRGKLTFSVNQNRPSLNVVNRVDLESYVASVVGSEMDFTEPEALQAQAVVSRTYALWSIQKSPYPGFDLRDHEASQMYVGEIRDKPYYKKAADSTRGEILTWSDQLILAVFSSTCGGTTSSNRQVWEGENHPYLKPQQDAGACSLSPHYRWTYNLDKTEFRNLLQKQYGFNYDSVNIEKDTGQRVGSVVFTSSDGKNLRFTGNEFRLFINRHTDSMALRSTKFKWTDTGSEIEIEGNGLGHGVGMCQWGARGLAKAGWTYKDILTFYFSGTEVVPFGEIENNKITLYN